MPGYNILQEFKDIDEETELFDESGDTQNHWTMSSEHENMKKSIEAINSLINLIKRSLDWNENAVHEIKDTIEKNKLYAQKQLNNMLKERVFELLYDYVSEFYEEDILSKSN